MTKKALCIGISYRHNHSPHVRKLNDAHLDARRVRDLLTNVYGYDDVTLMLDHRDSEIRPTRENILEAMRNLVEDASDGDRLVFHYSGHGSQVECFEDRMESDELDEIIWPEDVVVRKHNQENYIRDNEIHDILVENLPRGVRLTMIFDCCHSGTAADLPEHTHCPTKRGKFKVKRPQSGEEPEVVAWSACQDSQEVLEFKSTGGLLVYFLCECLNARPDSLTYGTVLRTIQSYTTQTYDLKNTNSGTNYETPISDISVLGDYEQALVDIACM